MTPEFWSGKRVFLTGHTGFKGAWLAAWLCHLGAKIFGYALPPETTPNLCDLIGLETEIPFIHADIRDGAKLALELNRFKPEIVFHLAAQSLVRRGYAEPMETFATNVMGTANLLQAMRAASSVRAVIVVTSDKCYDNREWPYPYRETDALGGADPYSASKACAEILTAAWRRSFFHDESAAAIATVRAGNVIGGGDFSPDRLIPDCMAARAANRPIELRNPNSTRPWQHVLDPLHGYLILAEKLFSHGKSSAAAYNFGPASDDILPVHKIVESLGIPWTQAENRGPHEAAQLAVDSSLARQLLAWRPRLTIETALDWTAAWYEAHRRGGEAKTLLIRNLETFETLPPVGWKSQAPSADSRPAHKPAPRAN
jgi:CDP-glucose 4,6-dehydratase